MKKPKLVVACFSMLHAWRLYDMHIVSKFGCVMTVRGRVCLWSADSADGAQNLQTRGPELTEALAHQWFALDFANHV